MFYKLEKFLQNLVIRYAVVALRKVKNHEKQKKVNKP